MKNFKKVGSKEKLAVSKSSNFYKVPSYRGFEEGYGEIDHLLRYPHTKVPKILEDNILLLNRIAGSADEMASFINILKRDWFAMMGNYEEIIDTTNNPYNTSDLGVSGTSFFTIGVHSKKLVDQHGEAIQKIGGTAIQVVNRHGDAIKILGDAAINVVNKHDQALKSLQKSLDTSQSQKTP
ncbi:hypothetical protein [Paenibacillus sp. LjRoot56]|uniref:hypothetical protein n=1 Tax=Paenibacillus sp. LjRoot56 TaxID=3342333 RepID=UPI003ECDA1E8